jgi:hypothetical protein
MPTYTFRNTKTEQVFDLFMKMSEKDQYLADNPDMVSVIGAPLTVTSLDMKPDNGFRDVLKEIRGHHDKRFTRSTINTF